MRMTGSPFFTSMACESPSQDTVSQSAASNTATPVLPLRIRCRRNTHRYTIVQTFIYLSDNESHLTQPGSLHRAFDPFSEMTLRGTNKQQKQKQHIIKLMTKPEALHATFAVSQHHSDCTHITAV